MNLLCCCSSLCCNHGSWRARGPTAAGFGYPRSTAIGYILAPALRRRSHYFRLIERDSGLSVTGQCDDLLARESAFVAEFRNCPGVFVAIFGQCGNEPPWLAQITPANLPA